MQPFHKPIIREKPIVSLLILTLLLGFIINVIPTHAAASTVPSCAISPSMLGGQGFSLSGQGFTLSGQGFSLSGQGFSLSGQGFSLSGQGFSLSGQSLDPQTIVNEIVANPVKPGKWVTDRLAFFFNTVSFNTQPTAILLVDEFSPPGAHGFEVQQVVTDSLTEVKKQIPDLHVDILTVDISDAAVNFNGDLIASKIETTINNHPEYQHWVLNMSFGLIACDDPGPNIGGQQLPAFNFAQAQTVIQANNNSTPTLGIAPILECVVQKDSHTSGTYSTNSTSGAQHYNQPSYIAYFGYRNDNAQLVSVPIGDKNKFNVSNASDQGQPTQFEPGLQHFVFSVPFSSSITWTLKGKDNVVRTISASSSSPRCTQTIPTPSLPITPILECVENEGGGMYSAHFGYNNTNKLGSKISPSYSDNKFSPGDKNRGQIVTFIPGRHQSVFEVYFDGTNLNWTLNGTTITANASSPGCAQPEGFGVTEYLTQNLGIPQNQVGDYWNALADKAENDSTQTLRKLLHDYLQRSANPNGNFTVVAIASSGNYQPWLGGAPLAPASWPETIAVGATLGDGNSPWRFSQDGNVVAPGAGYPLGLDHIGAGTSFAAPAVSVLAGICSTTPYSLKFDGTFPPIVQPVLDTNGQKILQKAPIGLTNLAPLACTVNHAPTFNPFTAPTSVEGTSVSFQITATDIDSDPLIFTATGLPPVLSMDSQGNVTGVLGAHSAGSYHVTVNVTDNRKPEGKAKLEFDYVVTQAAGPITVNIDIKPLSPFNHINLNSHGIVPIAIFGSATFDVNKINPSTVTLAGAPVIFKWGYPLAFPVFVNNDRYKDLIVWVRVRDLQLTSASTEAILNGKTYDNKDFTGKDKVKIVGPHAPIDHLPPSGSIIRSHALLLTWEGVDEEEEANTCYRVVIATNSNFSHPIQSATVVGAESYFTFQLANGTYYWHVAVSDCATNAVSSWSETWSFTIR